jgi:sugar/nucleoside kinase (ribokinase family)
MFVAVGTIIIDDIVTSDGRSLPGILGGAATHAAAGMRVWTKDVGVIGNIGDDFPVQLWTVLQQMGFDLRSVRQFPQTTPRAWQIYDAREHRTEIVQSPGHEFPNFAPTPDQVAAYPEAQGFHLMTTELDDVPKLVAAMRRAVGALILWEPAPWHLVAEQRTNVLDLVGSVDIISPNAEECTAMLGPAPPDHWIAIFLEAGAKLVSIRMGREGSLIGSRDDPAPQHVAAISLGPPVDVTGAGNAYSGGLLVGYHHTHSPAAAGLYGAISAAITLQHLGVPTISDHLEAEARRILTAHI